MKPISGLDKSRQQTEEQQQQRLALLQRIVKTFYLIHLIFLALCYTYLLIFQKNVHYSFTMVLLAIYCYMIFWVIVLNFFFVLCQHENIAVIFNRVVVRLLIMLYLPFGIIAFIMDQCFHSSFVMFLMIYMALVSLFFCVYEIYGCTCGEQNNPEYIFQYNDLHDATEKVWNNRRQYNKNYLKSQKNQDYSKK